MAFPLTPEAALCSCFRILLQDLAPILRSKDLLRFWSIDAELKIFQKKISKVQDLLNNAEERSQEICVNNWMDDLRELSYDMENLVDEMNIERARMEQQVIAIRNQAGTSHHVANRYTFWDNIADYSPQMNTIKKRINDALARLDEVLVEAKDLELKTQIVGRTPMSSIESRVEENVGASVDESDVYGRQKDQDFVIQELLSSSSNKNYSVISIAGMGGVGKTTLARLIFDDQRVNNFDVRSWACVSDAFDAKKVVKELIEYATDKNVSNMAAAALRHRLEEMVKGKKILIVLDDVWEVKAWDSLKVSFTHCAEGSKILVTTRDKNVGNSVSNKECYELKTLEDEDCWHLFKGVAFGEVVDEKLENIGREIVKKCKGVPLAVKVIGSTLRFASDERWENALRNELWQLEDGASDEIFPALKLSYRYLPSPIKRCFGYISLFPTDYELKQDKVVRLWIAEGFIESKGGRSSEDIGHEYYKELQRRFLIQENERMHDLIHSLACSVSGKFSYRMANGNDSCMHMGSVRHLSVIDGNIDLAAFDESKHLRTLFLFGGNFSEMICDQSLLRVLYLAGPTSLEELPISIGRLKYLRYLDLFENYTIEYLPNSICELQNLQTLDLEGCYGLRSLPNDIGDLQKLRYLHLRFTSLSVLPTSIVKLLDLLVLDLTYCEDLSQIPEDIGNLVSLRELHLEEGPISSLPDSICKLNKLRVLNLGGCKSFSNLPDEIGALQDLMELNLCGTSISYLPKSIGNLHNVRNLNINGCEKLAQLPEDICNLSSLEDFQFDRNLKERLPRGIGGLRNIKRLDEFVVGKEEGWGIEELNGMNKLKGSLTISHLENVDNVKKALMASLKSKIYINCLYFKWSSMDDASDVGSVGLTTRDSEMEAKVLEALEPYPTYLVTLSLKNYHGERVPKWMAELRFPSLKKLTLNGLQCMESVIMDVELPSLKLLRIENCPKLIVVSMALPNLMSLHVSSCQELTTLCMIPSLLGFTYASEICSLQSIYIVNCPGLVTFLYKGLPPILRKLEIISSTTLPHLPTALGYSKSRAKLVSFPEPRLQRLKIASWKNLPHLLRGLRHSTSLTRLTIKDCPELVSFPEEGLPPMLRELKIVSCTNLQHLPRGLGHNTSLKSLTIKDCPELVSFPEEGLPPMLQYLEIASCTTLRHLPSGLEHNTSLTWLRIQDCLELVSFPNEGLPPMLEDLEIDRHMPRGLGHNTSLMSLTIQDCPELVLFPEEGLPPMLQDLSIRNCTNLRRLPTGLGHNTSLTSLQIQDCPELVVSFPEEGLPPKLQKLKIASCINLRHLPRGLRHNTLLTSLQIQDCPDLVYFPEEGLPPKLQNLEIASWENLPHLLRDLRHSTSLRWLTIRDYPELVSFPDEGLPPMLRYLTIRNCTNLRHLPTGLRDLTSLKTLELHSCPVLGVRSDDQLPPNLQELRIVNCSKLEQQLKDEDRKDWLAKSSFEG